MLDESRLRKRLARVVATLREDVRSDGRDERFRRVGVERDDVIHAAQGFEDEQSIVEAVDRAAGALKATNAGVGIDRHDQDVTETLRAVEVCDVPAVEDVEAAVGEHDPSALSAIDLGD